MSTDLETRITRLEKSLRFYRVIFSGIGIVVAVFLVSSFGNKNKAVPDKIVAKAFEVVDDHDRKLVSLSSYSGSGAISTLNAEGQYLIDIVSNSTGYGNINVYDGKGQRTLEFFNTKNGGGAINLKNKDGKDALKLGLMTSGAGHVSLNSAEGNSLLWFGESTEKNGDLKVYNYNSKIIGRFTATNISDGSIELWNSAGNRMISVTTDVEGKGAFTAFDKSGARIGRLPQ